MERCRRRVGCRLLADCSRLRMGFGPQWCTRFRAARVRCLGRNGRLEWRHLNLRSVAFQYATLWSGVVKLRGYKLDGKSQIGLDVLTWWLAMGGLPGSLVVQLAINKQRGLPVSFLLMTLWIAVCTTVWVITWVKPNRLTDP